TDMLSKMSVKVEVTCRQVREQQRNRMKISGQHIAKNTAKEKYDLINKCIPLRQFKYENYLLFFTKEGMIKRSELKLYDAQRYSKTLIAINLKEDDELVNVFHTTGHTDVFIASNKNI